MPGDPRRLGLVVPLWDDEWTEPPGKARNAGTGEPRMQQTFDPLAHEFSFGRALLVRYVGEFDHQLIVQGDRDLRHGRHHASDPGSLSPEASVQSNGRRGAVWRRAGPEPCGRTSRRSSLPGLRGMFFAFCPAPTTSIGRSARVSLTT